MKINVYGQIKGQNVVLLGEVSTIAAANEMKQEYLQVFESEGIAVSLQPGSKPAPQTLFPE